MSGSTFNWVETSHVPDWTIPSNWDNITQGQTPALTVPGSLDIVQFSTTALNMSGVAEAAYFDQITMLGGTIGVQQAVVTGYLDMWSGELDVTSTLAVGTSGQWTNLNVGSHVVVNAQAVTLGAGAIGLWGTAGPGSGGTFYTANLTTGGEIGVDANSMLEVGSGHAAVPGAITIDPGYVIDSVGGGDLVGNIVNNGLIECSSAEFWLYNQTFTVSGTGVVDIPVNGTVYSSDVFASSGQTIAMDGDALFNNAGTVLSGDTVVMSGGGNTLLLQGEMDATIYGFNPTDTLLVDWPGSVSIGSFDGNNLELVSTTGSVTTLHFGDLSAGDTWTADPYGGVHPYGYQTLSLALACFAAGSRISTPNGPVAVEDLREGDDVMTVSGRPRPIKWIGYRILDCRRHPNADRVQPIRIAPHAFALNQPRRPLLLSPDHAVYTDNVLIPIKCLLNGKTIAQIEAGRITYYHVELASHDVILAEDLPVESYLETGSRAVFDNSGLPILLHPEFNQDAGAIWEALACAPLVVSAADLAPLRDRLASRAAELAVDWREALSA
jgi:hypothetical protein